MTWLSFSLESICKVECDRALNGLFGLKIGTLSETSVWIFTSIFGFLFLKSSGISYGFVKNPGFGFWACLLKLSFKYGWKSGALEEQSGNVLIGRGLCIVCCTIALYKGGNDHCGWLSNCEFGLEK